MLDKIVLGTKDTHGRVLGTYYSQSFAWKSNSKKFDRFV